MRSDNISVAEVEDVIALWQPVIDFMNNLKGILSKANPELSEKEISSAALDITIYVTNQYFIDLANAPSPW